MKTNISAWRNTARGVIARIVQENRQLPENELRKKLKDAYPFGERKYHPYKIWLSEQRIMLIRLGYIKTKSKRELKLAQMQDKGPELPFK